MSKDLNSALFDRLRDDQIDCTQLAADAGSIQDARELVSHAAEYSASWIIVDGYLFSADYQHAVKESGLPLLVLDDYAQSDPSCADLVVNPGSFASEFVHKGKAASSRCLFGPTYAPLRREFWSRSAVGREHHPLARHVLVTLGGSDPDNITDTVMRGVAGGLSLEQKLIVVVGASNPHYASLVQQAKAIQHNIVIVRDVRNMAELMQWADIAIAAAGSTCWELAAMGVPSLVVPIAENQLSIANGLHERAAAINLGRVTELSTDKVSEVVADLISNQARRTDLSSKSRHLVDGRGAHRVVDAMRTGTDRVEPLVMLRRAVEGDSRLLWEWANEPDVRAVSFASEYIRWEDHLRWVQRKLTDPACHLYIALDSEHEPIGQIRLEFENSSVVLSVVIDSRFRGRGYGAAVVRKVSAEIFSKTDYPSIEAFVKPANYLSLALFRKAGFQNTGEQSICGQPAVRFLLNRRTP